ncbi:rim15, signal transduction response regulator [Didymella keratinophila]|nr:rim15, signal transduction response regulator [Didymella keratinophila]
MYEVQPTTLAPPAVTALRKEASGSNAQQRVNMARTVSQDMREEREDLKEAAEHSLNIIMDLDLAGKVRYVSPSWKDVVGTAPDGVVGKPVLDLIFAGKDGFAETIESVRKYDSRSHIARFSVCMGPHSILRRKRSKPVVDGEQQSVPPSPTKTEDEEEQILNLEAQGIMVYDRATGAESHTMWMVRPSVLREVTIDLPEELVESLGVGAEVLAHYLTGLAEQGANDPRNHPPPLPVLCRICERQITPWWFEKHSELCLQEHRAEMNVQMAQETLSEHRNAIVRVLDTLEAQARPSRASPTDPAALIQPPEYHGHLIQPLSNPSSGTPSGRNSPASPPSRSRERSSASGFGHHRARSFAVRRPLARIVELVLDLCDTALEVNTPAIKDNIRNASEIRTQSPQSENRISQVLQWQSPTSGSTDFSEGLRLLCEDTNRLAKAKIDAVFRHRQILEYSERLRIEFDILVQECIEAAIVKAARIAAGEDSSSDDEQVEEEPTPDAIDIPGGDEGIFPGSFDAPSAMAQALRNASDTSLPMRGHLKLTDFGLSRMGMIGRQKRALKSDPNEAAPDLLKTGPFHRAASGSSASRSASFDLNPSPSTTPSMTPALAGDLGQPSYFSLSRDTSHSREQSRRTSGNRSDSADSDALQAMFRRFSIADSNFGPGQRSPIEEEDFSDNGSPDILAPTMSNSAVAQAQNQTPPATSHMPPPHMTLFDPEDNEVFQNILARRIDWPSDEDDVYDISDDAKDLMNRLMCSDPAKRLGANAEDKYASGGEEIRAHPWFADINWESLRDDEASFIPAPENPEDTEYFDTRGAAMANFSPEFEDQGTSSAGTPSADYPDRPHDALSRVRSQVSVSTMKRGLIPLHIPAHVREGRSRRLSEPMAADDFGNFSYKNLPVLEKANKDVIQKLRAEAMLPQNKQGSAIQSPTVQSPSPSLDTSPMLPGPLKRALSTTRASGRPVSPSMSGPASSPSRGSQPSSPLLVQFSTGQHHERRKTSSNSSTLSHSTSNPGSLQPGSFFDPNRLSGLRPSPEAISPGKPVKAGSGMSASFSEKLGSSPRQSSTGPANLSPRVRSQTVGSQEGDVVRELIPGHHKRRSQVLDVSPSSSDTEDSRAKALLRVQRRRQSSRRLSQISFGDGPFFRPLDVLICEDHPVSRLVMEKLLEKLRCRTLTVTNGSEAIRYAMGEVKFDIIMMEFRLPQVNGADVARMIRDTKNANTTTPIVAVTGYLKELQAPHYFDALIEKPPTIAKLTDTLGRLCQWKPPPPNWAPTQMYPSMMPSGLRQESTRQEDSPTTNSNSSGFSQVPGSYRGSSREDSISSSFFGDNDSRTSEDVPVIIARHGTDDWRERDITQSMSGLGVSEHDAANADSKEIIQKRAGAPDLRPELPHEASAPAALEAATIRRQRSAEQVGAKRRLLETRKHESAESGDDEDEELGHTTATKTRSPKTPGRPKSSSKLGIEMMRTNSRGSVISVETDMGASESALASSPPPAITEDAAAEEREANLTTPGVPHMSLTPPEIFPAVPGKDSVEFDMDAVGTPKQGSGAVTPDPDPTPKASAANHGF